MNKIFNTVMICRVTVGQVSKREKIVKLFHNNMESYYQRVQKVKDCP